MKSEAEALFETELVSLLREHFTLVPTLEGESWPDLAVPPDLFDEALGLPLLDFLSRPSKELRARLVEVSWAVGGGAPGAMPRELPYLLEMLHAGSLIVDDIQDDSTTRRGGPALHRLVGVPLALNAGNWLYFWALLLLGRMELPPETRLALYRQVSVTLVRCHQGQALDLHTRVHALASRDVRPTVEAITTLKTGALMELAAMAGAIAAGAPEERVAAMARFGRNAGLGLQMLDDVGGITAPHRQAKGLEDLRHARATWAWAFLVEESDEVTFALAQRTSRDVAAGHDPEPLRRLLRAHVAGPGRTRAEAHLDSALCALRRAVGHSPATDAMTQELHRLRRSYD